MDLKFLREVLSQPTAPFREHFVIDTVRAYLDKVGAPYCEDDVGNLLLGVESLAEYEALLKADVPDPVMVFIAHMDHPGFHGVKWMGKDRLAVKWLGGSPTRLLKGTRLWVGDKEAVRGTATILSAKIAKHGRGMESAVLKVDGMAPKDFEAGSLFGAFHFKQPHWTVGDRIYTKAADDLVGVATLTSLAAARHRAGKTADEPRFVGLLTRAEEVGFIGCIGHFRLGLLTGANRRARVVSLETSRTFPGAVPGLGPVVRVGDRATAFDPGATQVFTRLAEQTLKKRFQKRLMDGGTCEGTVSMAFGVPTIAISIPLGNYHNESFEGGPQSRGKLGPGPEFVHLSDVKGMYKLCEKLLEPGIPWEDPWGTRRQQFEASFQKMKDQLL